jgi:hypothetical protein
MLIPNTKTRNFTLCEIIHRPEDFDLNKIGIAYAAMGYMQRLRDELCDKFKKDIAIKITSGYRSPEYNRSISTAKEPDNSYHVWRIDKGEILWAIDFTPSNISTVFVYEYLASSPLFKGEMYFHRKHNFIHIAPNSNGKKAWIQQ